MNKVYLLLLLFSTAIFAQQKRVVTSIDTTKNKIGAEFKLTVKTSVDTLSKVDFPKLKNIGALEVIRSYPIDTIKNKDRYELIKKYGLTQFDSGKYTIPSIKILINSKPYMTDSISVEVANVQVDTLKQKMYDIKDIVPVKSSLGDWWKYLLILALILGIGALVYWFVKKQQKKKIEEEVYKTPIEKATSLLNTLEQKELWQKGEVKAYYSELTDIARNYIEEAIDIPAMESTTSELILGLRAASLKKKMTLSQETIENLERVLKQADLVKFAKSKPVEYEITEDRNKIQKAILTLDSAIPVEIEIEEDTLLNEAQKQKQIKIQLKKKRSRRILIAVASVVFLLLATTTYFIVTKGFDYVKDTIIGHPTKELLEAEWIRSTYGNPGVTIETPKVLRRIDLTKSLPKNGLQLVKEMQSFAYGSFIDNFYLMVSTIKYKQDAEIDLKKSMEVTLQTLESQGAQNMIVKQEDFDTKEGVTGLKSYGTFSRFNVNSKSSEKLYYEIVLFSQEGGLQQIMIFHEEGDSYANEISDRVLSSVELIQLSK
ncbi:Oxygen tolerance [Flavobacterium gillisiae]|uniref:Oxygen tolerance n=1 Tax=Flavobacterium gillisiae TaxID=150146 RepID=A0A1H4EFD4_9FLAO|nr:BatD family protein [Flavobacterium gillisiae]SEA83418.1 Oxygen tolerance [Flavobacterium gillisiae]